MQAQRQKVTVSTVEIQDGDDFSIKTTIKKELLDDKRPLMDSTIEIEAVRHKNWLDQAKSTARRNARDGVIHTQTDLVWIEAEKDGDEPVGDGPGNPVDDDEKTDSELNLAELRAKYPSIKATSIATFLEKVSEL